jgi:hypothetical protein
MFIASEIGSIVSPVGAKCSDVALLWSVEKFGTSQRYKHFAPREPGKKIAEE